MLLRGTLSNNWSSVLPTVTKSYNNTPLQRLGWLKPNDIKSEESSVLVDKAKRIHKIPTLKEATYQEQKLNTENFNGDLKVGDFIYKDFDAKLFDKSFDVAVSSLWSSITV